MTNPFPQTPDFSVTDVPVFGFIREASNLNVQPHEITGELTRWSFDLSKPTDTFERYRLGPMGDLPRIAGREPHRDTHRGGEPTGARPDRAHQDSFAAAMWRARHLGGGRPALVRQAVLELSEPLQRSGNYAENRGADEKKRGDVRRQRKLAGLLDVVEPILHFGQDCSDHGHGAACLAPASKCVEGV